MDGKDYSVELFSSVVSGKKKIVVNGVTKFEGKQ
jgi:hypothetical protein